MKNWQFQILVGMTICIWGFYYGNPFGLYIMLIGLLNLVLGNISMWRQSKIDKEEKVTQMKEFLCIILELQNISKGLERIEKKLKPKDI